MAKSRCLLISRKIIAPFVSIHKITAGLVVESGKTAKIESVITDQVSKIFRYGMAL